MVWMSLRLPSITNDVILACVERSVDFFLYLVVPSAGPNHTYMYLYMYISQHIEKLKETQIMQIRGLYTNIYWIVLPFCTVIV